MAIQEDFQIDRRVGIAMDALSSGQKEAITPLLRDKEGFVSRASRPGVTRKLSATKPLYSMNVGKGIRVIFTRRGDAILVQDIVRKATLDQLVTNRKLDFGSSKMRRLKRDKAGRVPKA